MPQLADIMNGLIGMIELRFCEFQINQIEKLDYASDLTRSKLIVGADDLPWWSSRQETATKIAACE